MMNDIKQRFRYLTGKAEEKIGLCFTRKTIMNRAMLSYSVHHYGQFLQDFQKLLEMNSRKEIEKMWKIAAICKTQLGCSKEEVLFYLQKVFRIVEDQNISFELAQRWEELYDNNRACMWLKETLKINPHFQDCYQRYFALVRQQKGVDEAVPILKEWYTHNIFNTKVILRIIEINNELKRSAQNLPLYRRLIDLNPKNLLYYTHYINLYIKVRLYFDKNILKYCNKAIKLAQKPMDYYHKKMFILLCYCEYQLAFKCTQEMLRLDNKSIKPYCQLFNEILCSQQAQEICRIFQKQAKNGTIAYMGEAILSFAYFCLGKHQESNQIRLRLLANTSQRYYSLVRGLSEILELNLQTAIKYFEEFQATNEIQIPFFLEAVAFCYQSINNYPQAIKRYTLLQKCTPCKQFIIKKAVAHFKNGNFVESQRLIDLLINTFPTFQFQRDKFYLLQMLINVDQISFHKQIFDFQQLSKMECTSSGYVRRHIILIQFYYKDGELDVAYKRLCDLLELISADKEKPNTIVNNYSSIVRVVEMCLNFQEHAKAEELFGILDRFYKSEKIYPQIAEWKQMIERRKQDQSTPKP